MTVPTFGDISEFQDPAATQYGALDGWIIRATHQDADGGIREDAQWRTHFNNVVRAGKPLGLYHFMGNGDPVAQALFFRERVAFLTAEQVMLGWWLDAEWGQGAAAVDAFRAAVQLPTCGLYSTLSQFNGPLRAYLHFGLNWLPLLPGWRLEPGWEMPDHILTQTGQAFGVDIDTPAPAQPYPVAWQSLN